jgi:hypothetical protein
MRSIRGTPDVQQQGMTTTASDPRYPVGPFTAVPASEGVRREAIEQLAALPARIREAVSGLTDAQLDTPYRPGGWTVRQVVHHVADSHMNGFTRMKLALTEDRPTVKPYDENAFATLADMRLPVEISLGIIDGLHARWVAVARALTPDQLTRIYVHPEHPEPRTVEWHLQDYAWHSRHHVAHITELRRREGW